MFFAPLSRTTSRWLLCELLFCILATQGGLASAASPETLRAIETVKSDIQSSDLDEESRQSGLAQLEAALSEQQEADSLSERLRKLRTEDSAHPAQMERLREAIGQDRDEAVQEWAARLPENPNVETLELVLEQERAIIAALSAEIDSVAVDLVSTISRPAETAGEIGTLNRRIEELSITTQPGPGESALLAEVRSLRRNAERLRVTAERDLLEFEQQTTSNRQRLYELQMNELRYRQQLHVRRIELLESHIVNLARGQMEALLTRLADSAAALAENPGMAAAAAAENVQFGDELMRQNEQLSRDRRALLEREQTRLAVAASLRESRTRLELGGTSEAVGRWLWSERRNLESPARLRQQQERMRNTLADLRLRRVEVNEARQGLLDVPMAARAMLEATSAQADEGEDLAEVDGALEPVLTERLELLTMLDPLLERRIDTLEQSDRVLVQQLEHTLALRQLLDRHLLWAPSHGSLGTSWLQRVPEGFFDLVKPSRLLTTLELSGRAILEQPLRWTGALLILIVLIELRRRAPHHIEAQAAVTRQIRRDSFRATARALGWTLLAALPGPVAFLLVGELLQSVGNPGRYSDSLGQACTVLVLPLFTVQFLRWTAMERGLGHAHFRWLQSRREALRRRLSIPAAIVLTMYFISSLALIRNLDLPNDVQARLAILIACVTLAWTLWRLLDVGRIWVVRGVEVEPSSLRQLLRMVSPAVVLTVAGLALTGYVYSAGILLDRLFATFSLIVAIAIATGLLGRWFLLGERRLAWSRLEERRAAARAADPGAEAAPEPEADITLEQVNAHTSRLLRVLRLTLLATGVIAVWAEVLPAAARLDEIVLWHFSDVDADGLAVSMPVSFMDALLGVFALALTIAGARNLPGLIEIGMQSITRIDAASRYAITSILRYAIIITGVVIGLGLFGMRWSQLQWLAAALTVGLGFGLQEIFANFVSGLILLFERPFRVGDIITVGDLSGKVTKIRTRATTILDFDNKEIVVPNKSFITGQLINWTLSDATTRVTIRVGVAYGTAPRRVHELLRQAALGNPLVLAEPDPKSWFLAFGASSLDFELRVFVGDVSHRLPAQDQLNTRIAELFAENGIEIAFPQLDLHVRDVPPPHPQATG